MYGDVITSPPAFMVLVVSQSCQADHSAIPAISKESSTRHRKVAQFELVLQSVCVARRDMLELSVLKA